MGRALLALMALIGLFLVIAYLGSAQVTNTTTQHTVVDNHTTVTITNNIPPDFSGIALIILGIAALLYVVFSVVIPAIRNWR